jgi:hypothetical protein
MLLCGSLLKVPCELLFTCSSERVVAQVTGSAAAPADVSVLHHIRFLRQVLYLWDVRWALQPILPMTGIFNACVQKIPVLQTCLRQLAHTEVESIEWFSPLFAEASFAKIFLSCKGMSFEHTGALFATVQCVLGSDVQIIAWTFLRIPSHGDLVVEFEACCLAVRFLIKLLCKAGVAKADPCSQDIFNLICEDPVS